MPAPNPIAIVMRGIPELATCPGQSSVTSCQSAKLRNVPCGQHGIIATLKQQLSKCPSKP